jgi:hypothetical protein
MVVSGEGRAGMIRHRGRPLVLLVELRVYLLVLGVVVVLEVLQMLLLVPVVVLLLGVVALLRGARRDSVLAHDATAGGSLWVVDEGFQHGGGTKCGGGSLVVSVMWVGVGGGERQTLLMRVLASISGGAGGGIWLALLVLGWTSKAPATRASHGRRPRKWSHV